MLISENSQEIINLIQANRTAIDDRECPLVQRFYAGKHRRVFTLKDYPEKVIKIGRFNPAQSEMWEAIREAGNCIKEKKFTRCFAPNAEMYQIGDEVIWIEDCLEGVYDSYVARDQSVLEFMRMRDEPELREKWIETFTQAAEFIILNGYWDVDWRNVLLMANGVGFVDFEKTSKNPKDIGSGLLHLFEMAPTEAIDPILEIVEKRGFRDHLFYYAHQCNTFFLKGFRQETSYEEGVAILKAMRQEEIELIYSVIDAHKKRGVTDSDALVDGSKYPEDSLERKTIDNFNAGHNRNYLSSSLVERREVYWQPFVFGLKATSELFEQAIDQLKKDGVIITWIKEPNQLDQSLDGYKIYFY